MKSIFQQGIQQNINCNKKQSEIEDDTFFYYIDEGEVQLYYDLPFYNNGFGIPIQTVKSKNFIGLYEFFSGEKRHESARCQELTNVYSISRKDFLDVVKNFPQDHVIIKLKLYIQHRKDQMYITLRDQMVYQKNYKLFGLKCFLCERDDHLSHQCVEVQLKKDMMRKNQQRLHPDIVLSSDSDDENNQAERRASSRPMQNFSFAKKKSFSQTMNLQQQFQEEKEKEGEQQKYYNLDLRLKYDVQQIKKPSVDSGAQNLYPKRNVYKPRHNQVVQSSQFNHSPHSSRSVKSGLNAKLSQDSLKPNYSEYPSQRLDEKIGSEQVEYVFYSEDHTRSEKNNLRKSRRHSSLVDIAQRNYETAQNIMKSQAEMQEGGNQMMMKSQEINILNSYSEGIQKNQKSLFSFDKSFRDEKGNLNQLGLDREQRRQLEKQQKERVQKEQENRISLTRQNIAIQRKINNQQLISSSGNLQTYETNVNSQFNKQYNPFDSIDNISLRKKLRDTKQNQLQELELMNQRTSLDAQQQQSQREDSRSTEQKQEFKGLLAQVVQKMMNEGNIISENALEYTQSIISRKNENEHEEDIDVPPLENSEDINYVFYKYCRLNQY